MCLVKLDKTGTVLYAKTIADLEVFGDTTTKIKQTTTVIASSDGTCIINVPGGYGSAGNYVLAKFNLI